MNTLVTDSRYFAQVELVSNNTPINWDGGVTKENVIAAIRSRLGPDFVLSEPKGLKATGLVLYDILTELLPHRSSQVAYFWNTVGRSFASMLDTAKFPLSSQAGFLIWYYARVIGFMGPEESPFTKGRVPSIMTNDGSPIELSWMLTNQPKNGVDDLSRGIRFCIEPIDPRDGSLLPGGPVLDYLTSPQGSLGVVECKEGAREWVDKAADYLFPNAPKDALPEGSRFFVGFDFKRNGTLTLKVYLISPSRPTAVSLSKQADKNGEAPFPIYCGDADWRPFRKMVERLDPVMVQGVDKVIEYFESLEDRVRPRLQMIATDCIPSKQNRIKLYSIVMEGTAWPDVKRAFTLGGRLSSPEMDVHLGHLEALWNELFPYATSAHNCDIVPEAKVDANHDKEAEKDPTKAHDQHPRGGLYYYYELSAGKTTVSPKWYVPSRHYCRDDLSIAQSLERFYKKKGIDGLQGGEAGPGWVSREISKAYNHRPLEKDAGIQTFVSYGAKSAGWEVTDYFSPELWI